MDLALNNLQRLICHKIKQTKPNQTKPWTVYILSKSFIQRLNYIHLSIMLQVLIISAIVSIVETQLYRE